MASAKVKGLLVFGEGGPAAALFREYPGQFVADSQGVGMAGAEQADADVEPLSVSYFGLTPTVLVRDDPRQCDMSLDRTGMFFAENTATGIQDVS